MTKNEADKIIGRLTNRCTYHRFNEPGVTVEYQRVLAKYNYEQMNIIVDTLLENDSKNVPPISALIKACRENKTVGTVVNTEHCEVCDDKGFVFMTENQKNGDKELQYDYVLYCPFCPVGRSQAYNGQNCKEYKTNYIVPPLTQYFDDYAIEQMKQANREKNRKVEVGTIPFKSIDKLRPWERSDADDSEFCGEV